MLPVTRTLRVALVDPARHGIEQALALVADALEDVRRRVATSLFLDDHRVIVEHRLIQRFTIASAVHSVVATRVERARE